VKGRLKWWLVSATILSILLSWGSNLEWFTDLFFYYFPMYNKFRVVSMILVVAQLTMPVLGIMALHKILINEVSKDEVWKWLKIVGGALACVLLLFAFLGSGLFDFESAKDANYPKQLIDALASDRMMMMRNDCLRGVGFLLVTSGVIWAYINQKLKSATIASLIIGTLVVSDFWSINKLYLNEADFVSKKKYEKTYTPSSADQQIQQDTDPNFRVLNTSVNTFNDATTSYYHKSIGGYHGAKLRRYQDIIERHISQNNVNVMNMLNTKYIIGGGRDQGPPVAQRNPGALGNAWFVNNIKNVATANEEIDALTDFNPRQTAIVHQEFSNYVDDISSSSDSTASIRLTSYSPNAIEYSSQSKGTNLAVFSEVHYPKGWNAYIDGQATNHIRTNYLLRGLKIPAGNHKIEFKFEPKSYYTGEIITLICSSLLMLGLIGYSGSSVYHRIKQ
ncbi:MAG: YfhO family protein, partial [Flavobacteriaceae bacterium]